MATQLTSTPDESSRWDDKFDRIVKWFNSETKEDLPPALAAQLQRWTFVYGLLNLPKHRYERDTALLKAIGQEYPDLSERTARMTLRDTRRFFGILDAPDLAFERVMLIAGMKETMQTAREQGDVKALTTAERNYMLIIGADKAESAVENKTVINVINYNPVQISGDVLITEADLDKMVESMIEGDRQKKKNPFDDYEDVSATPTE